MPQGEATHTPMGPHDYLVKTPFTGFHIPTEAPERFVISEVVAKTGESTTDILFRRRDEQTVYHVRREEFQKSVFPK